MQTVESLCTRYGLDMAHARRVAETATQLFDETHRLGLHVYTARERALLHAGAMLLDIGVAFGDADHHLTGRDLVLAAPLQGFSQIERAILACIVGFHDGDAQPERESLLDALDDQQRRLVLTLAALARVADALDATRTQTTAVRTPSHQMPDGVLVVRVCGPHSHADAECANAKAGLWRATFGPVIFDGYLTSPGLSMDDLLAEAYRKTLRYRLDQAGGMAAWRIGSSDEATPERVRKLRAAARRMRNDLRLFGPGLRSKPLRAISGGLRDLSSALRRVRAWDALLANLRGYAERCDEEDRAGLSPLAELWGAERMRWVEALVAFTTSDGYQDWLDATLAFAANGAGERAARRIEAGRPSYVRHIAASTIAQHLAHIRSYDVLPDPPAPEQIHALRVAIRRLRHTVEALQDVLPPDEARTWLQACAAAQDAYGAIHDAHQAATSASQLITQNQPNHARGGVYPPRVAVKSVAAYAEAQRRVVAARLAGWRDYLEPFL
ncbi:MAG: CHAD domain-containing protein [Anaerolineae bacterium]|nr:CHAD domain-containing protein [Candidatus Roseilinea sp.]MDW8450979.1 CHAD domain-containing protein [Anaerolineae bacterium]